MSDRVKDLRGKQVTIGVPEGAPLKAETFIFPRDLPDSDEEILERVELDARIELALEPFREVVKLGTDLQKALRDDAARAMAAALGGDRHDDGQLHLFQSREPEEAGEQG